MIISDILVEKIPSNNDSIFKKIPLFPQKFNNFTIEDQFPWLVERDCSQWFNYEIKNASDAAFIGINNGHTKSGLLGNVERTYHGKCGYNFSKIDDGNLEYLFAPMFRTENRSVNKYILDTIYYFNELPFDEVKFTKTIDKIPDASLTFFSANPHKLHADLKINDLRSLEYHRCDGVTKIKYYIEKLDTFNSYYMVSEGFLAFEHAISEAYIKTTTKR